MFEDNRLCVSSAAAVELAVLSPAEILARHRELVGHDTLDELQDLLRRCAKGDGRGSSCRVVIPGPDTLFVSKYAPAMEFLTVEVGFVQVVDENITASKRIASQQEHQYPIVLSYPGYEDGSAARWGLFHRKLLGGLRLLEWARWANTGLLRIKLTDVAWLWSIVPDSCGTNKGKPVVFDGMPSGVYTFQCVIKWSNVLGVEREEVLEMYETRCGGGLDGDGNEDGSSRHDEQKVRWYKCVPRIASEEETASAETRVVLRSTNVTEVFPSLCDQPCEITIECYRKSEWGSLWFSKNAKKWVPSAVSDPIPYDNRGVQEFEFDLWNERKIATAVEGTNEVEDQNSRRKRRGSARIVVDSIIHRFNELAEAARWKKEKEAIQNKIKEVRKGASPEKYLQEQPKKSLFPSNRPVPTQTLHSVQKENAINESNVRAEVKHEAMVPHVDAVVPTIYPEKTETKSEFPEQHRVVTPRLHDAIEVNVTESAVETIVVKMVENPENKSPVPDTSPTKSIAPSNSRTPTRLGHEASHRLKIQPHEEYNEQPEVGTQNNISFQGKTGGCLAIQPKADSDDDSDSEHRRRRGRGVHYGF